MKLKVLDWIEGETTPNTKFYLKWELNYEEYMKDTVIEGWNLNE